MGKVALEMIGTLMAENVTLESIDLRGTGLGQAISAETEGGHIILRPLCASKESPLHDLLLSEITLSDKGGAKLFSALQAPLAAAYRRPASPVHVQVQVQIQLQP